MTGTKEQGGPAIDRAPLEAIFGRLDEALEALDERCELIGGIASRAMVRSSVEEFERILDDFEDLLDEEEEENG